ncbi:class E sortase [Streptomyces turgidiscabies]|uniref:Sortase family protein n=1 Tax=Streptomyces turgidiscabies (strain Car8) TaxID=698760 RepID=L7FJ20_STRT8|nr:MULTISPECIES: class E sortase [Streptomyces]ELP70690.1 sortase family protein [Streptomyces turgidiscabies Car8]MDX3496018.1 class E sortase [Streptomyces turgidiscabies]GAQ72493.1 sortase family protein [Streptomyces turgidiscabies]
MRARAPVIRHRTLRRRALRRRALWSCGELLVTLGTVLALLVVHQLWWTNRQAEQGAQREVRALEKEWGNPAGPGGSPEDPANPVSGSDSGSDSPAGSSGTAGQEGTRFTNSRSSSASWSQAYAILSIPRLGLRVPVAEGVSKPDVLNKGYVGHYPGTQQPGRAGNFALAGHRNTHGEPFRYINRLRRGDAVRVETADAVYTYTVDRTLPQTSARDDGVIRAVPRSTVRPAYGYRTPGHYLTLTTCTPEYTSRYRLVVWGTLTSMRPR